MVTEITKTAIGLLAVMAIAGPAFAQAPLNHTGTPAQFHSGTAACHILIGDNWYGVSILQKANATSQCDTLSEATFAQRLVTFSLTGGTVPCSPQICAGVTTSPEIGDVLVAVP